MIVTRQTDFQFGGAGIANSIEDAIAICGDDASPFVTGGAEIYRAALPLVTEIHLTRVHTELEGDTFLPGVDWTQWVLEDEDSHERDEKNNFAYSFETYQRIDSR